MKKSIIIILTLFLAVAIISAIFLLKNDNNGNIQSSGETSQETEDWSNKELATSLRPIDSHDHFQGSLSAPVQIVVYNNFESPFLPQLNKALKQVKDEFGEKAVVAWRHFYLTTQRSALPAALASECAAEQGKFWEMYDKLIEDNELNIIKIDEFKNDALDIGLDMERFNNCLEQEKYKEKIQFSLAEANNIGIIGAPTIFINQEILPGAYPFEDFTDSQGEEREGLKSIIERHLSR